MAKLKNSKPQSQSKDEIVTVIEGPGGTPYIYANIVQITWSLVDLKVRFGELTKIELDGHNTITERCVVTMAWPQAKMLQKFLEDAVLRYEQANGEIKIIPELKLPQGIVTTPGTS